MKILVIGKGGREHALVWRLAQSPDKHDLFCIPGNPGIAQLATCLPEVTNPNDCVILAKTLGIDLTIVGPEFPLSLGIVDNFRIYGLKIVGPTQAAAQLEVSKIFAKEFFQRNGIPTARSVQVHSFQEGTIALSKFSYPIVIKANGLFSGKGVVIAYNVTEAQTAIENLGPYLVIEEFLEGQEVSFIGLSNGKDLSLFMPSRDHKRLLDGDQGPNTGGMGAYCSPNILTSHETGLIMERIMLPTLHYMKLEGSRFTGFLYAGIMMTEYGPKVLEFNTRLGDPETQALMHSFRGDLADLLLASTDVTKKMPSPQWGDPSICVVLAAHGYPETPCFGDLIYGVTDAEALGATVFHAGTMGTLTDLRTNGGRVLGITTSGELPFAKESVYKAADVIHFDGIHYRRDIGRGGS